MVVTKKERGYLASLLDRYSRRCVGWAISAINDTALTRLIAERQPGAGLIHHSDHGSNYTSGDYQARLIEIGDWSQNFAQPTRRTAGKRDRRVF